jgi:hypothetical protein
MRHHAFVAALLGSLLLVPAARAAAPIYKVSAYGIQRTTTTSSATATGRCFDERGSQTDEVVSRFKTPRGLRARFASYGSVTAMLPLDRRPLKLTGSVERKVTAAMEHASCADLNPDGSPKWVPKEAPESCSLTFDDYTASISFNGRTVTFDAQQPELAPLTCVTPTIPTVMKRVSLRQIVQSPKEPIRVQSSFSETTAAPDGSSTTTTKRLTTVYIQFRKIG